VAQWKFSDRIIKEDEHNMRNQSSLGTRLPVSVYTKFNDKAKKEGRIKKVLIVRLLRAYIEEKYSDVLEDAI
jgi:hypothetical protein